MPSIRSDTPASASIAIHTATKMIVDPKSGWRISRNATAPVSKADSANTGSDLSASRSDSSQAIATTKKGFRNSDGWNWRKADPDPALARR